MTPRALALGLGLPSAIAVVGLVPWLVLRQELPTRVASHFDLSGTPDQSMSQSGFLATAAALMLIGALVCVAPAVVSTRLSRPLPAVLGFLGGFVGGLGAGILAGTALSQRGIDSWREAESPWWVVALALLAAALLGAAGARLAAGLRSRASASAPSGRPPVMDLAAGEKVVWSGRLSSSWALMMAVAMVTAGLAGALFLGWPLILLAVGGFAASAFTTIRVRADASGLDVKYGIFPWPRTHIGIARIARATPIDVRPRDWGGWGYRGSLRLMNQAAVVLRAGPGVRLDLADGKTFAVTVDDPEGAVGLINAEIARGAGVSGSCPDEAEYGVADRF